MRMGPAAARVVTMNSQTAFGVHISILSMIGNTTKTTTEAAISVL